MTAPWPYKQCSLWVVKVITIVSRGPASCPILWANSNVARGGDWNSGFHTHRPYLLRSLTCPFVVLPFMFRAGRCVLWERHLPSPAYSVPSPHRTLCVGCLSSLVILLKALEASLQCRPARGVGRCLTGRPDGSTPTCSISRPSSSLLVMISLPSSMHMVVPDGTKYVAKQMHFHWGGASSEMSGSEHTIEGIRYVTEVPRGPRPGPLSFRPYGPFSY